LYNIPIEFGITMKLVRLFKMCLNENYNEVHICKNMYDPFSVQNGLKQDVLLPLLFNFAYGQRK
jgi:hypothetical protein